MGVKFRAAGISFFICRYKTFVDQTWLILLALCFGPSFQDGQHSTHKNGFSTKLYFYKCASSIKVHNLKCKFRIKERIQDQNLSICKIFSYSFNCALRYKRQIRRKSFEVSFVYGTSNFCFYNPCVVSSQKCDANLSKSSMFFSRTWNAGPVSSEIANLVSEKNKQIQVKCRILLT